MRYVFSVVRFVPDPVRGETVNVGAIVGGDDAEEWEVRQIGNFRRAKAIDEVGALPAVTAFMTELSHKIDLWQQAIEEGADPDVDISEAWLAELQQRHRNVVQLTPAAPITADSLGEALDIVTHELLVDPVSERLTYQRRTSARAALRSVYRALHLRLDEDFYEDVTIRTAGHTERLDFAVANGSVVQLAQAWSFQVPDQRALSQRVRAWGWTLAKLKRHGGEVRVGDRRALHVDPSVDLEVVYVPPANEQVDRSAFVDAQAVFEDVDARAFPVDDAEEVAAKAHDLLSAH